MRQSVFVVTALALAGCFFLGQQLVADGDRTPATPAASPVAAATAPVVTPEPRGGVLLTTERTVSGLVRPIYVTHAPGDTSRIFIIEKQGRIRVWKPGVGLLATAFLDIDALITGGTTAQDERGLLGLAFHPDYATNFTFYVYYTDINSDNVVARYTAPNATSDTANPAGDIIFFADDFATNHNGGWIGFGPDNYLWIATGDGGSFCDPNQWAQNLNVTFGKMLRVDVDGADNIPGNGDDDGFPADANRDYTIPPSNPFAGGGGRPEVWAYGLRNPSRNSFDRLTGDLYIGDVGQDLAEEIDYQASGTGAGRNYGWDCEEGLLCSSLAPSNCSTSGCVCGGAGFTDPIHSYNHVGAPIFVCAVTGGYVYRGCAIPDLRGTYFFADYCSTQIWSFRVVGGAVTAFEERTAELAPGGGFSIASITSFGEDALGEIYICDQDGGEVFKIIPRVFAGPDCNANSQPDLCDIARGVSQDNNADEIPDECQVPPCPWDLSGDGFVNALDAPLLLGAWGTFGGPSDFDGGGTGSSDLALLLGAWGPCPPGP